MLHDAIIYGAIGLFVGGTCTLLEVLRPAHPMSYKHVVARDVVAFLIYMGAVYPIALALAGKLDGHIHPPLRLLRLPIPVRMILYYLVADLGSYILHRVMHTKYVWRIHKWHHSPKYMYWFAGVRATIPQQFLFNLPAVVAIPILFYSPAWVFQFLAIELIVRNDWMHMNVTWRSNWIEWIFVTPRYHHIHHSADPRHLGNFGSLFSIWDRMFGTRIDPDTITGPLEFGTGEVDDPVRTVVGF